MAEGQNEAGPLICTSGPAISGEKPITPENLSGALNTTILLAFCRPPRERNAGGDSGASSADSRMLLKYWGVSCGMKWPHGGVPTAMGETDPQGRARPVWLVFFGLAPDQDV